MINRLKKSETEQIRIFNVEAMSPSAMEALRFCLRNNCLELWPYIVAMKETNSEEDDEFLQDIKPLIMENAKPLMNYLYNDE